MRPIRRPLFRDRVALSKPLVFALCLLPLAWLVHDVVAATLGPDPVAAIEHRTGDWALRFLLLTLTLTPLRRLTGRPWLLRYRRLFGLFAFAYATMHLTAYIAIDLGAYWVGLPAEIAKRPYLAAGFAAWVLLVPLAATSTRAAMRRLGRHWQRLHRLAYVASLLGALHYVWLVKSGEKLAARVPLIYLIIWGVLMALRLRWPGPRPHAAATE